MKELEWKQIDFDNSVRGRVLLVVRVSYDRKVIFRVLRPSNSIHRHRSSSIPTNLPLDSLHQSELTNSRNCNNKLLQEHSKMIQPILLHEFALAPRKSHCGSHAGRSHSAHQVVSNEKEFRVSIDLPGVKIGDISLTAEDGTVNIRASRRYTASDGSTTKKLRIEKSFAVPDERTAEFSKVKANLADGVLVVTVPRKAKPEPVVIEITGNPHEEAADEATDKKEDPSDTKSNEEKKAPEEEQ